MKTYRQGTTWIAYQDKHPAAQIRRGGMCQWFARNAWGASAFGITAYKAWLNTPASWKHVGGVPPAGSIAYWKGGSSGAGHAAPVVEGGYIWSTDIKHKGQIDKVHYTEIAKKWGQRYLGYITRTPSGPLPILSTVKPKPVVHVSRVQPGRTGAEVLVLQKALASEPQVHLTGHKAGTFDTKTQQGYQKWQRHLGFTGADADGKPGITSLTNLGGRHGFRAAP